MKTYLDQFSMLEIAAKRRLRRQQWAGLVVLVTFLAFVGGYNLFSWSGGTVLGMGGFVAVSFCIDYTEKLDKRRARKEKYVLRSVMTKD